MLVVKVGGAANVSVDGICADLATVWREGGRMVVMHGGSDETNRLAEALGHPPRFVTSISGHTSRVTDQRTLEIFMMATALVNRQLVERLQAHGVQALGLSGLDGRLIEARRKEAIRVVENGRQRILRDDWTGTPERVNVLLLTSLLDAGYLPVIAPVAVGGAGEALNIDGDRGAALLAGALQADTLVLLTNVPGLLRHYPDESTLVPSIPAHALGEVVGSAEGRMRKKLLGAAEALAAGVHRVVIADGRVADPLHGALNGAGTVIENGKDRSMRSSTVETDRALGEATDYEAVEARHATGVYGLRGITLVRGMGATVWDSEGREYLDCTAAYGVASLGHCHPTVVEAISAQASKMISCPGIFANDQRALLLEEISSLLPTGLDRIFLCNSGTEAVETSLKVARLSTGRPGIVAAMQGFHGRTMGALSATWSPHYRKAFEPLLDRVRHAPYNDLSALESAIDEGVGAVILEVVQGEGGVRHGTTEFLQRAQGLCRERGALLILDEVQTGFGRTGRMFALEHHGLEPDVVCLAKGIAGGFPMGAVALGARVAPPAVGAHGSTFGGNPLACAAARATLRVLQAEDLPRQAAEKGAYLLERLRAIPSRRVREVRGLGLMVGIELRERATPVLKALQDRGVLALNAGPTVLRLLPPLTIEYDQIDQAVQELQAVLAYGGLVHNERESGGR